MKHCGPSENSMETRGNINFTSKADIYRSDKTFSNKHLNVKIEPLDTSLDVQKSTELVQILKDGIVAESINGVSHGSLPQQCPNVAFLQEVNCLSLDPNCQVTVESSDINQVKLEICEPVDEYKEKRDVFQTFRCCLCNNAKLTDEKELQEHMQSHVKYCQGKLFCGLCKYTTKKDNSFKNHVLKHHCSKNSTNKRWTCKACSYNCLKKSAIISHLCILHMELAKFECKYCPYKTDSSSRFRDHNFVHINERPFRCPHCPYTCRQNSRLKIHVQRRHQPCLICQASSDPNNVNIGQALINVPGSKLCSKHRKEINSKKRSRLLDEEVNANPTHLKQFDSRDRIFKCHLCDRAFFNKSKLLRHLLIHQDNKNYHCDQCDYATYRMDTLRNHKITHTQQRSYWCVICSRTFKTIKYLRWHIIMHAKRDRYLCPLCPYASQTNSLLKFHLQYHTEDMSSTTKEKLKQNPFPSSEAYKKMVSDNPFKDEIYKRIKKCVGEIFTCVTCSFTSPEKRIYKAHLQIHREKSYLCNVCAFRCNRKYNLTLHILTHYKDRPYVCHLCPFSSKSPSNLKKHKKNYHSLL
ncbi:zinc finger protein 724-like [Physella acuta]|uniref:zinc finger protein 724-like n=1 Tax=Physella acuta TaxID=109671 RepID=UPI0027DD4DBE|nr:zinc finger protein 724-like [Physella acuta]XP_059174561.1 zinc finger protein 724-like [Physella acuta]XP_059174562.1 zinc finger protein 724-like [Physella acuta]